MSELKKTLLKEFKSHLSLTYSILKDENELTPENIKNIKTGYNLLTSNLKTLNIIEPDDSQATIKELNEKIRLLENQKGKEIDFRSIPNYIQYLKQEIDTYFFNLGLELSTKIKFYEYGFSCTLDFIKLISLVNKRDYYQYKTDQDINNKNLEIEDILKKTKLNLKLEEDNKDNIIILCPENENYFNDIINNYFNEYGNISDIYFHYRTHFQNKKMELNSIEFHVTTTESAKQFQKIMSKHYG